MHLLYCAWFTRHSYALFWGLTTLLAYGHGPLLVCVISLTQSPLHNASGLTPLQSMCSYESPHVHRVLQKLGWFCQMWGTIPHAVVAFNACNVLLGASVVYPFNLPPPGPLDPCRGPFTSTVLSKLLCASSGKFKLESPGNNTHAMPYHPTLECLLSVFWCTAGCGDCQRCCSTGSLRVHQEPRPVPI